MNYDPNLLKPFVKRPFTYPSIPIRTETREEEAERKAKASQREATDAVG